MVRHVFQAAAALWFLACIASASQAGQLLRRFEFSGEAMAAPVRIVVYGTDSSDVAEAVARVFCRLEELNSIFSDYDPESELSRLSRLAPTATPVEVSLDMWEILNRSLYFSELTGGAFDITAGPVVRLWRRARRQRELPDPQRLSEALSRVSYRYLKLDAESRGVMLLREGMHLDLGGIAKGYAAEQAMAILREAGLTRALVDIGGDICLGDAPPSADGWRVAIEPLRPEDPPLAILSLSRCAIATSGDTQRFVIINGTRYSHIVDPRTGQALTGNMSVTVVAPDGTTADAMASALRVLGPEAGLPLVDKLPDVAAFIAYLPDGASPEEKPHEWRSTGWALLPAISPRQLGEGSSQ